MEEVMKNNFDKRFKHCPVCKRRLKHVLVCKGKCFKKVEEFMNYLKTGKL